MDKTRIIPQGEVAKFKLTIADFDMSDQRFKVELIYGYRRTTMEIEKEQMLSNGGRFYFVFDTDAMVGRVTARCTWYVPDEDMASGEREEVDEQFLCFVVPVPCPKFIACPACQEEGPVSYERVEESDVTEEYSLLCDCDGNVFVTRDRMKIWVIGGKYPYLNDYLGRMLMTSEGLRLRVHANNSSVKNA